MNYKNGEKYDNKIYLIGKEIEEIKKELDILKSENNPNKLENRWHILSCNVNNEDSIEEYFNEIILNIIDIKDKSIYSDETFSFTIIYSLDEIKVNKNVTKNIKLLLESISSKIKTSYYHPFIILLAENEKDKEEIDLFLNSDSIHKIKIDKRNIECFVTPLNKKEKQMNIKLIKRKIYKIFSYYFEMGDEFRFKDKIFKLYDEPKENLFPINILILGKTQVGKSTFINTLLKEKRAKEGGKRSPETKAQISYHVDNIPLIINDIEGFTGEETIDNVVNKINLMQNDLGEKELHLVIYIIDYLGTTYFNENEYKIFKQLSKKLDTTQFLFLCSKSISKIESEVIEEIQEGFYDMIKNGSKKDNNNNNNILNVLNYLYLCQKKEITFDELNYNQADITKEEFNKMNLYEKLELKFKNYSETEKNREMTRKIIEKNNNLIFYNLILDKSHDKNFGMDKISKKIREALTNIKFKNMIFLKEQKKYNEERITELDKKINHLYKILEENEELSNFVDQDNDVNKIRKDNFNETQSLLNESLEEIENEKKKKLLYIDLINSINEKKNLMANKYAIVLKEEYIKSLEKDLSKHIIGGYAFGLIPFVDILLQQLIKKNAKEKIANKFKDDLIDFNEKNLKLTEKEKYSLKEIEDKSDDKTSNILKSMGRAVTLGINIFSKVIILPVAVIGCAMGSIVGGQVMKYDINAYLEFYGNRFLYRCLVSLSFDLIVNYFKENFENDEDEVSS